MKIAFLGNYSSQKRIIQELEKFGRVSSFSLKIEPNLLAQFDLIISYGYRHILTEVHLAHCSRPPLNLHISYLPFNKGAHPNFWAWYEGTPHGVSIHHIDAGIDTGDLVYQDKCEFEKGTTLLKSYLLLKKNIEELFCKHVEDVVRFNYKSIPQREEGTFHKVSHLPHFQGGWDQTIESIRNQISSQR